MALGDIGVPVDLIVVSDDHVSKWGEARDPPGGPFRPATRKPRISGAFVGAAEWSRTITPRKGHKPLKPLRVRSAERNPACRAKSDPATTG